MDILRGLGELQSCLVFGGTTEYLAGLNDHAAISIRDHSAEPCCSTDVEGPHSPNGLNNNFWVDTRGHHLVIIFHHQFSLYAGGRTGGHRPGAIEGGTREAFLLSVGRRLRHDLVLVIAAAGFFSESSTRHVGWTSRGGKVGLFYCPFAVGGVAECMADLSRLRWLPC